MNLLVADDDPSTVLMMGTALRRQGHHVIEAADGEEAWAHLRRMPVDVVLSDWMMPRLDGITLCKQIRSLARERYLYVILLTSLSGKERFLEGMEAGADDFLRKPVDFEELGARLRVAERILGLTHQVAQLEGLLSICSYCKKIRDDSGVWVEVERYVGRRTELKFSHGICATCKERELAKLAVRR
jgi:sigma-B regulation protein RsbU (phosphoserine phosphatase)